MLIFLSNMTWLLLFLLVTCKVVGHSGKTRREAHHRDASSRPVHVPVLNPSITPVPPTLGASEDARRNEELEKELLQAKQEIVELKNKNATRDENLAKYRDENKAVQADDAAKRQQKQRADAGKTRPVAPGTSTGKRRGKHKGSKGGGFKRPASWDRTKRWRLTRCTGCRASLDGIHPTSHREHFIIDVKQRRGRKDGRNRGLLHVITRHVIYRYKCPCCGKLVSKDLGWFAGRHYGLGFVSFVLQQRVDRHGSWQGIRNTACQLFGEQYIPTIQACIDWVRALAPSMEKVRDAFIKAIKSSPFTNSDETSLPMDGKNWWMWVLVTTHVVLYMPNASRGHEVIAPIFEGYKGVVVSDFFSAYNMLDVEQQKCLAHLIVELKKIEHEASKRAAEEREKLAANDAARQRVQAKVTGACTSDVSLASSGPAPATAPKRCGRKPKEPEPLTEAERAESAANKEKAEKVFQQASNLQDFFKRAFGDGPMGCKAPPGSRMTIEEAMREMQAEIDKICADGISSHDIERIINRLTKFASNLFTYLNGTGVPPDNSEVERVIRYFVAQRKISGKFINPDVVAMEAMLLSVFQTCARNDVAFDRVLPLIIQGNVPAALAELGLGGDGSGAPAIDRPPVPPVPPLLAPAGAGN